MLRRIIALSVQNRLLVVLMTMAAIAGGIWALRGLPLEALPDLSDVQVIVQTDYGEQAPHIVEDQVTYPIAAEMLKVPGARTVRGYSFFGVSFVYVIFDDGTDLYWARSRVLEYLNGLRDRLPEGATPRLGPDANGLGWVYQYTVEDTTGRMNLAELRGLQDWHLRYALTGVPGVAEVASIGGFEKQYQVDVDPARLQAYGVPITRVMAAIQNANADVGAMVMELSEREYMVRGLGYLESIGDIENVVVGATSSGTPIRVAELGRVTVGPAVRRGLADLDGRGDAVGGIVVMRWGENALATIDRVKARLAELAPSLPAGVVVRPVYDRSDLIHRAIDTLREKLVEESIAVALVCVVFLLHVRSALVAIITLPIGILMAFLGMRAIGVGVDIMSLGGIAIAIGAMIDAAIVMIENMHKHLERALPAQSGDAAGPPLVRYRGVDPSGVRPGRAGVGAGGGSGALSVTPHHHRVLHPGLCARGPGGAAVPSSRLHQELRDGCGQSPRGDVGAGGNGLADPRAPAPRAREPHQPLAHRGVPAGHPLRAPAPVGGRRWSRGGDRAHLDSLESAGE